MNNIVFVKEKVIRIMCIGKDAFGGMYLMENNLIFEITSNCTLVTNLYNYTLPLIRYQMSDRLEPTTDTTHVLPFTKTAHIIGREEHIPIFINSKGDEDFIRPLVFTDIFVEHLDKLQVHIHNKQSFTIKITLMPHTSEKEAKETINRITKQVRTILDEKLMTNVKFSIQIVDHIWADARTGKFQLIVQNKKN